MKLSEVMNEPYTGSFIFKQWDGHQPDGDICPQPFDVQVQFRHQEHGYSRHPYGNGSAREDHGSSVSIVSLTADQPVELADVNTGRVVNVLPKGTSLNDIPGWEDRFMQFFATKAEEYVDSSLG